MSSGQKSSLLRLGAFVLDGLAVSLALILPASVISYSIVWATGEMRGIALTWYATLAVMVSWMLLRDGYGGRSLGKKVFGLRVVTRSSNRCSYWRSVVRNLPLIVPLWNVIEIILVLVSRDGRRSGDRIAGTTVCEE